MAGAVAGMLDDDPSGRWVINVPEQKWHPPDDRPYSEDTVAILADASPSASGTAVLGEHGLQPNFGVLAPTWQQLRAEAASPRLDSDMLCPRARTIS